MSNALLSLFSQKFLLHEDYCYEGDDPLQLVIQWDLNWQWGIKRNSRYAQIWNEIVRDFEQLSNPAIPFYSANAKCIVESQPTWDMSDWNNHVLHAPEDGISAGIQKPCPKWRMEPLAYYAPAHFNNPKRYGIHLTKRGIAKVADQVHKLCPKEPLEIVLLASAYKLFAHELCHSWIEDICCLIDFSSGEKARKLGRRYATTNRKYNSYIFMEEAICNSAAYGWLQHFLHCKPDDQTMPGFDPKAVICAFEGWMRAQPSGYRDFLAIKDIPPRSTEFIGNIWKLIVEIYGFSGDHGNGKVAEAIGIFFGGDLRWDGKFFISSRENRNDYLWQGKPPLHITPFKSNYIDK